MSEITEVNDYRVVQTLSKRENGYTFIVLPKGMQDKNDDYYKILKLREVQGNYFTNNSI
jgi:hypothetical protein